MNPQENISTRLKRRTHLIDRVIYIMLQNMYPCDYNSSDHFVEGVLDEIRWFLLDVEELQGIERADIENYILDYKYDELTEYFNERCIVLKNDNLQESIKRILREEEQRKTKTDEFQKLIDDEIESMKEICKQMGADDEEIISFDACDFLDLDPKVIVTDVDKFYGKLRILVVIKYEAAMHFHDEEAFIYELQWRLKWVGDVMIDVEGVINTYPNDKKQW